ncbi:MAG: hypothetical protein HY430_00675 [Candidatus Levybacteria bacterium]|nr:hypothetical protein [Candidatus Levybacteria bacterium]
MYKRILVQKLTGSEKFKNTSPKEFSVLEFWQYGFSNLNSNVLRGALAEFLVENALRKNSEINVRNPWGDSDVLSPNGKKIEVKCCSYIQDWDQNELSRISWAGLKAKTLYWSSAVSKFPREEANYKSDIYVLALLTHQIPTTLDILDMNQWCFYVLPKQKLIEVSKSGNSLSLRRLEKNGIKPVTFKDLAKELASA